MFFPRLRRHAKWMFVFLAVALGGGFVLFGVGAGGTGVGDILRGGGARAACRRSRAPRRRPRRTRRTCRPGSDLSTALQTDGQTDEAIDAQKHVVVLAPKDTDALRELAGALPRPGDGEAAGGPAGPARGRRTRARGQSFPGLARRRRPASRSSTTGSASSLNTQASTDDPEAGRRGADGVGRGRRRRTSRSPSCSRTTRTSSSSSPRQPSRQGTRRRRSPPTRRS